MAESGGLENRCVREGTVGSNPTPSAVVEIKTKSQLARHIRHALDGTPDVPLSNPSGSRQLSDKAMHGLSAMKL